MNFPILATLPFGLGEVDLTSIGVTDQEVADAGLSSPEAEAPMASATQKLVVDDDLAQCPDADFVTISAAVGAALSGAQIEVCPGTYIEQVTIPLGKDGLTLFSKKPLEAVIKAPPVTLSPKAIVRVAGAQNATIRRFTITGPGGPGDELRWGVRVDMGGSATIRDNHITEIHDTPFSGAQHGIAVDIGRGNPDDPDGIQAGSGTVSHNLVDGYQKGGILVDGATASATVEHNEVVGVGPTPAIAQNGIQVSRNAQANVNHNKVSANAYTGIFTDDTDSSGILLFDVSGGVTISHNKVETSDLGLALLSAESTAIANNKVRNSPSKGVASYDSTSNSITSNDAKGSGQHDCFDDNMPTLNTWSKDKGDTQNQPGLCKKAETNPGP